MAAIMGLRQGARGPKSYDQSLLAKKVKSMNQIKFSIRRMLKKRTQDFSSVCREKDQDAADADYGDEEMHYGPLSRLSPVSLVPDEAAKHKQPC